MHIEEQDVASLSLIELKEHWSSAWNLSPPARIGRQMLERSLVYKILEQKGYGLTPDQKQRLNKLVTAYKRNLDYFDQGRATLKSGMRLIRNWKGSRHVVTVTVGGFEYQDQSYSSLSQIANDITGSRWNGWVFFGVK